jgi:alpha-D-xyloside xylohydrolase
MKFSDGYWMMREGVTATHPVHVHDVEATATELTVFAVTTAVEHRGDTLNAPLVTVSCTAPMDDVIGVRITHHQGERPKLPNFEITADPAASVRIEETDGTATFASGRLAVSFATTADWAVDFTVDGQILTSSPRKAAGFLDVAGAGRFVREQLTLGVGEQVYGMGERFGPFVKNGQAIDIWNADGGTSSEQAYKNIPFYLTSGGYGVFVNHPGHVSFEVGSEVVSRVQFSVGGESLQYFVIYGPTPKEILRKYTALTGRPALPPAWSFGLWLTTSFTTDYDEATVSSFVDGMAERNLPLSVFHFDAFWMREFNWCDFTWDARTFPDPVGMLARLKAKGLRICVWINPYIAQRSPLFAEGMRLGYLVKKPNGDVWQWDRWQAGMGLVDFTNPDACGWYADKLRVLLDMGVDCFKSDFGERIPTDVEYFDGSDPERMHNYYTQLYNRTVFELLVKQRGASDAVLFARSATAGGQQFPVHWGGDCSSSFESMAESLRGGLSLAMSGFGFWSHDIGGFEGTPEPAIFKRWIPFGLLSSHSRLHGNESYRVPWTVDEESVDVLRIFTNLKLRLMPYIYAAAIDAHDSGVPVMRPMALEFPADPACAGLDRQYMLGGDILVAPVFSASGRVSFYLPAGRWTHLQTGEVIEGPRWVEQHNDYDVIPVYVRPGSVIPMGAVDDRPEYDFATGVTLCPYQLDDGARTSLRVPDAAGELAASFLVVRDGDDVEVRRTSGSQAWSVQLPGSEVSGVLLAGRRVELAAHDESCVVSLEG